MIENNEARVSIRGPQRLLAGLSLLTLLAWMGGFCWSILDQKHSVIAEVDLEAYFLMGRQIAEGKLGAWEEDYFRYHGHLLLCHPGPRLPSVFGPRA